MRNNNLNQLAQNINELTRLFDWVEVDNKDFIAYWLQHKLPEPKDFRAEMEQNIDEVIASTNLIGYKNFVWKKIEPIWKFEENLKSWLSDSANTPKGNAFSLLLFRQAGLPLPDLIIDPKDEIRGIVTDILVVIKLLMEEIVSVWDPLLHSQNPTHPAKVKTQRINSEAKDKHKRIIEKYEKYIKGNYTHSAAIRSLVHDFRHEYGKGNQEHTKKTIQDIIRKNKKQNNKE